MARTHVIDAGSAGKVIPFRTTITPQQALGLMRRAGALLDAHGVCPQRRTAAFGTVMGRLLSSLGCRHMVRIPVLAYRQAGELLPEIVAVTAREVRHAGR
ncbi:MAG TPA: hypothetical protein PKC79_09375 [Solidesulfovibrio magneticus]|nr:hypothetical protein [Solidesulfovibrio magneticus]